MTWDVSREIAGRIVLTGDLELTAPAHFGSGEPAGVTDMTLLRDALEDRPLLPGTSLAGALRGYLLSRVAGYQVHEQAAHGIDALFGGAKGDDEGAQSPLIIDDALAVRGPAEVRDGVKIDPGRRTARDQAKFDVELLPTGTRFPLRFELLLGPDAALNARRMELLALALGGLEQGAISVGARRTRGYGACRVTTWTLTRYDLTTSAGLLAWLADGLDEPADLPAAPALHGAAATLLAVAPPAADARRRFTVTLACAIDGALLIRSDVALNPAGAQPDFVHLRDLGGTPILPGTSLAGALRARALRIAEQVQPNAGRLIVDRLFGRDLHTARGAPTMSRLLAHEAPISGGRTVVQSRVSIDRFTGGALDTALFSEAPQFGGDVTLNLELRNPQPGEIGLLLLLIKDLWTGDLTVGGERSVGRGRLRGVAAELTLHEPDAAPRTWTIRSADDRLAFTGDPAELEAFVTELNRMEAPHEPA